MRLNIKIKIKIISVVSIVVILAGCNKNNIITVDFKKEPKTIATSRANFQRTGYYNSRAINKNPRIKWKIKTNNSWNFSLPIIYKNYVIFSDNDYLNVHYQSN